MIPMIEAWATGVRAAQMMVEAHNVVRLRSLGACGLWPMAGSETRRMWTEKPGAFVESAERAMTAFIEMKRPDQIVDAALVPIGRATSANSRRLSRKRR